MTKYEGSSSYARWTGLMKMWRQKRFPDFFARVLYPREVQAVGLTGELSALNCQVGRDRLR